MNRPLATLLFACSFCGPVTAQAPDFKPPAMVKPTDEELAAIRSKVGALGAKLKGLAKGAHEDDLANVAIFHKAGVWIDRHDEFYTKNDAAMTLKVLDDGIARADALAAGKSPWKGETGVTARGYRSKVDGSYQPYFVVVPENLDRGSASRLDVVLHGRNSNLHEVRFLHDRAKFARGAEAPGLILHVFGRTNNAYRWAGESDVFEAIDAVKREFRVDENRILLRGFSMGGAGAWHLGLHHPSMWAAVDAGAGFTETVKYARQKGLSEWRQKALTIYDATAYALNAFDVPIAGYGGEVDPQLLASENMVEALRSLGVQFKLDGLVTRAEGFDFRRIVGKGMGHKVDPASEALLKTFRDEHAAKGLDRSPARTRFVTHTLKYNRAAWFSVDGMERLYERAVVEGELKEDAATLKTQNVTLITVDRNVADRVTIDGQDFPLREAVKGLLPGVTYRKVEMGWETLDYDASRNLQENVDRRKRPGLQGPIDDAFMGPFLVVKGTGKPRHQEVQAWADARLAAFVRDWNRWMRGDVPMKADTEIGPEEIERYHLILFGDPGSNTVLARVLKDLPLRWSEAEIDLGGKYDAKGHVPALIASNPLNPRKYVVVNSGFTFRPSDFAGTNALLFPRLGDYGVFAVGGGEDPKASGYFDERWRIPAAIARPMP